MHLYYDSVGAYLNYLSRQVAQHICEYARKLSYLCSQTHTRMRYTHTFIGVALLWAMVACSSGPSKEFVQQVSTELADLKGSLDKLNALKGDVSSIQDPFQGLKAELGKAYEDKVLKDKEFAEKLPALEEQSRKLAESVNSLESQLNSTLSELQSFVDGLPTQQKKDDALKTEWESLKSKLSEAAGQLDPLGQQVAQLKADIESLRQAITAKYGPKTAAKK